MEYLKFKSDLHHIHQSEVYGANVFKVASLLALSSDRKAKWRLLYQLEIQTLERFRTYLEDSGRVDHYPYLWSIKGYLEGLALALMPWPIAMRILARETQSFVAIWQRLKLNACEDERPFFDYVYAHEKAIEAFAKREIESGKNSVEAIRSLLSH